MADLISDAVQLARAGSSTSITVQLSDDLGFAEVDPGQIGQVLHNILLNARQATPEGGLIEITANRFSSSNEGDPKPRIRISIRDYGCGIPADVLPRIFDPYFTTKPAGNGLGLATAHAIIVKHGGQISVASKLGEGTAFEIDIPASAECPSSHPSIVSDVQRGTARVLVMDDDAALRYLMTAVLNSLGYEVETAKDGAEAIAIYEAAKTTGRPFEVCLLDLTVSGGMGGVETASKLNEIDPSAKLIVTSGYSDAAVMSNFAQYGFDAVITKPAMPAEVGSVIARVLLQSRDLTR
jgi:CheY-like chemotaxis protein